MAETDALPWERNEAAAAAAAAGREGGEALVGLPDSASLDAILGEQASWDRMIEEGGEAEDAELGRTPLESRAEVAALTRLHHRRRVLARALAGPASLFEGGQNPPAEAKRKQHRNVIATLIAAEQGITGDKQEARLERLANADPRHIAFCERLEALRVQYFLGRIALMEINEEIRDREESLRAYNAELRANVHGGGQT